MVDKPESSDHERCAEDELPQPPGEEVTLTPEPTSVVEPEDAQKEQAHTPLQCGPTVPPPAKRERDWYKNPTVILGILTLLVLAINVALVFHAQELTRNDQRAWVGIQRFQTPGNPAEMVNEGLPVTMNAVWRNFGKGPALQTDCAISMRIMRKEDEFVATYDQQGSPKAAQEISVPVSAGALWPGITYATPPASLTPNDQEVAEIRDGAKILYFYGQATYNDAFGRPHWTHFCCRYTPDHPGWLVHSTYNEAK